MTDSAKFQPKAPTEMAGLLNGGEAGINQFTTLLRQAADVMQPEKFIDYLRSTQEACKAAHESNQSGPALEILGTMNLVSSATEKQLFGIDKPDDWQFKIDKIDVRQYTYGGLSHKEWNVFGEANRNDTALNLASPSIMIANEHYAFLNKYAAFLLPERK